MTCSCRTADRRRRSRRRHRSRPRYGASSEVEVVLDVAVLLQGRIEVVAAAGVVDVDLVAFAAAGGSALRL